MPTISFYIKDDLYSEFRKIEKKSEFIDKLLRKNIECFKPKMTREEVQKELAKIKLEEEFKAKVEALDNAN